MAYTTIDKPTDYFNTVLYTGNGTTNTGITGVGFQPDWVWIKSRNSASYNNFIFDVIRGATKYIKSDATSAENTLAESLKSFDSDGFTVGTEADVNNNTTTYASWNWLAGGSASSNTDGSITSSVSANTTAGFSIVSYTGTGSNATVGHGLGSALDFIIVKKRNGTTSWCTTGTPNGWDVSLFLDTTDQNGSYTFWQSTAPTSSVFSIDGSSAVNGSSDTFIAYCFAEKQGYSKFGSYKGNANADGPFIYTGFQPAFVMNKLTSGADDWQILDNKRNPYNVTNLYLKPNGSDAETTNNAIDFLSNGFKLRTSAGSWNPNGGTFIYMAFAEAPFVSSGGIPTTAR